MLARLLFSSLRLNCRQPLARSSGSLDIKTPRQRRIRQRTAQDRTKSRLLLVKLNRGFPRSLLEPHFNRCLGSLFEFLPTAPHLFSAFPQPLSLSLTISLFVEPSLFAHLISNSHLPSASCVQSLVVGSQHLFVNSITSPQNHLRTRLPVPAKNGTAEAR